MAPLESILREHLRQGQRLVSQALPCFIGRGVDVAVVWSSAPGQQGVALHIGLIPIMPGEPVPLPPGTSRENVHVYAMSKVEGPPISDEAFVTATTN